MKFIRKQKQAHTKSSFSHRDYIRSHAGIIEFHAESQRAQSIRRCRSYVPCCERSYAASVPSASLREKKICQESPQVILLVGIKLGAGGYTLLLQHLIYRHLQIVAPVFDHRGE